MLLGRCPVFGVGSWIGLEIRLRTKEAEIAEYSKPEFQMLASCWMGGPSSFCHLETLSCSRLEVKPNKVVGQTDRRAGQVAVSFSYLRLEAAESDS